MWIKDHLIRLTMWRQGAQKLQNDRPRGRMPPLPPVSFATGYRAILLYFKNTHFSHKTFPTTIAEMTSPKYPRPRKVWWPRPVFSAHAHCQRVQEEKLIHCITYRYLFSILIQQSFNRISLLLADFNWKFVKSLWVGSSSFLWHRLADLGCNHVATLAVRTMHSDCHVTMRTEESIKRV